MTTLIITLPEALPTATTPCEGVLTEDGRTVTQRIDASLALLPVPPGMETVVVVPASRLSWHRLELPRGTLDKKFFQEGSAPRLRAVLEGLLEDRLLDEPSLLHFAIEPKARSAAPVWVAACSRDWLRAWLAALEQAGRPAARIVPELAPTAADQADSASLQVTGTPEAARLMRASPEGVIVLPLSASTAALVAWPDGAKVVAEPAVAALAEQFFLRPATLQTSAQRWLAAAPSDWDLAQFDLLSTRGARTRKRVGAIAATLLRAPQWRAARWAVLALVLINLIGLQAWAWKELSGLTARRAALRNTLTATFPEVRVVVDAPLQMARSLAELQRRSGTASTADLETMLGKYQETAPNARAPSAIEFAAGELRLKGLEMAATGMTDVPARLQARGYAARLEGDTLILKEETRRP